MPLQSETIRFLQTAGQALHDAIAKVELQKQELKESLVSQLLSTQAGATLKQLQELAAFERDLGEIEQKLRVLFNRAQTMHTAKVKPAKAAKQGRKAGAAKSAMRTSPKVATDSVAAPEAKPAAKKVKPRKAKPATRENLSENGKKVLTYLETVLNKETPVELTQQTLSEGSGVPLGSIANTLDRILKTGLVTSAEKGSYKLA